MSLTYRETFIQSYRERDKVLLSPVRSSVQYDCPYSLDELKTVTDSAIRHQVQVIAVALEREGALAAADVVRELCLRFHLEIKKPKAAPA